MTGIELILFSVLMFTLIVLMLVVVILLARSKLVATVPATPGAFSRIDEVEPPKIAP